MKVNWAECPVDPSAFRKHGGNFSLLWGFLRWVEGRNEHSDLVGSLKYKTAFAISARDILYCFLHRRHKPGQWQIDIPVLWTMKAMDRDPELLGKPASCNAGYTASVLQWSTRMTPLGPTTCCLRLSCEWTQTHGQPEQLRLHGLPKRPNFNQCVFTAVTIILISLFAKQNTTLSRHVVCCDLSSTQGMRHTDLCRQLCQHLRIKSQQWFHAKVKHCVGCSQDVHVWATEGPQGLKAVYSYW